MTKDVGGPREVHEKTKIHRDKMKSEPTKEAAEKKIGRDNHEKRQVAKRA